MVSGLEAEPDRSHEEKVAGEKFEVPLDGFGNVGVIVLAEGGFPQEGGSEEAGEDVNHHEGRSEESGGGMRGEVVEELREVFFVSVEGPKDVEAEGDEDNFHLNFDDGFDDGVTFAQSSGEEEGPHDFIERADLAGWPGGSNPKGAGGEKEGELESFDGSFFCRESGMLGKPGRKKNGHRTKNDQTSRDEAVFP